ncbi:hypothetical protein [uncultured Chryseobacterium sp.]|uniref:hypothetical protein n=1 Tax=uncultured Chryseobacterium sp. TaxID=259322 RepID=UPI0025FA6898|nr:hypothetical protein [uncultured Chryseobacterium sp.]
MFYLIFAKRFNSYEWKKYPQKRKYYLRSIFKGGLIIGKQAEEVEQMLGRNESCSQMKNRWTYALNTDIKTHKKYFLAVYFENGTVIMVRKEFKTIL